MRRVALLSLCSGLVLGGCGSSAPSEATIYYDPALRPGVVEATDADHELLARLDALASGQPVEVGGRTYVADPPYAAASGRTCRPVRARARSAEQIRVACEAEDGWVFVPDVLTGDQP